MKRFRLLVAAVVLATPACAQPDPAPTPDGASAASAETAALLTSVQARPFGADSVQFTLQVTNTTSGPIELNYSSGKTFDFSVTRGAQEVWRWSSGMMFTQALRTERLEAGATETHSATWTPPPGTRGEYTVRGGLTAANVQASQTATFRIE